ncbi:EF-hand domain-containing protein [Novosphingobium sp. UBA1939]|uniref:EF-hand domain-containing protein n=1 Tax=Novosphingobium sp. UBA1939 TaxID=1946982 RepID=UPI0025DC78E2|nr:EF-hand domain-containing protein [Novosphingobium sp. UBA1939]
MKKIVLGISAAAFALGAGALYAAAPEGPAGDVTWAEAKAKADEMWAKLDVNKDGKLDQADRDAKVMQKFDAIDTNHDGAISRDEFLAHHNAMRGPGADGPRADGPGAGPAEGHRWHRGGRGGPQGRGPGPDGPGMHGAMMGGPGMVLRMADANKDGVVTKAEYDAAVKAHFDRVDTNHDGKISKEERKAARDAMRARFGRGPGGPGAPGGDMPPPPPPPAGE